MNELRLKSYLLKPKLASHIDIYISETLIFSLECRYN